MHAGGQTPRRYEDPRDKWQGILGIAVGLALLAVSTAWWIEYAVIWPWGLGGGVGFVAAGCYKLWSWFSDKEYSRQVRDWDPDRRDLE